MLLFSAPLRLLFLCVPLNVKKITSLYVKVLLFIKVRLTRMPRWGICSDLLIPLRTNTPAKDPTVLNMVFIVKEAQTKIYFVRPSDWYN